MVYEKLDFFMPLKIERKKNMNKNKSKAAYFWNHFEDYVCSVALIIMTIVTFINVFSRKIQSLNLAFTQEIVTTMFVWVCCLAASSAFRTNSHMGFAYLTGKLNGRAKFVHKILRVLIIIFTYCIWIIYGTKMVIGQYHTGVLTAVLQMPGWIIGMAVPISGVLSIIRLCQYEFSRRGK
jgi:TRAP-type C4-dicarboxylate transport system permease small subunit